MSYVPFMPFITEITVEQTTCTFSHLICADDLGKLRPTLYRGSAVITTLASINQAKKRGRSLFNCISLMDDIKSMNRTSKGRLHLKTEFEAI